MHATTYSYAEEISATSHKLRNDPRVVSPSWRRDKLTMLSDYMDYAESPPHAANLRSVTCRKYDSNKKEANVSAGKEKNALPIVLRSKVSSLQQFFFIKLAKRSLCCVHHRESTQNKCW
jgi:hypothetical protein